LLSDSFKETVKSFFFDISANLPAQCTRADWCLHASNTPGSDEIIKHVLICRYGSRNEAWRPFTPVQSRLFCVYKPWSRLAHFHACFQTWYHVNVNTALVTLLQIVLFVTEYFAFRPRAIICWLTCIYNQGYKNTIAYLPQASSWQPVTNAILVST
jgi:hypothetical protein